MSETYKNIEMQVLGENGYEAIYPVPASHASKHASGGSDPITPANIGAVPTSRTVNGKALSANITLAASDVSAYSKRETDTLLQNKADLDENGKVSENQLPEISAVKTFIATIGTTWTENKDNGVKSQSVPITGVLAKHTAKVDHAYTGDGTSDGYAAFVEAENQYLTCITNGYAETYDGGVKFYIFGDAPTVSIPIVVEVA